MSLTPSQVSEAEAEEANFKANFLVTSLSTTKADVFGVKFIGPYGTVGLLRFGIFLLRGKRFVD